jgi:hypothetical protein
MLTITQGLGIDPAMQECIERCLLCHASCEHTAGHCLQMRGEHASKRHQVLLKDCAQICLVSADFMLRGSILHRQVCDACAEICFRCGEECRRLACDDTTMLLCAESCHECAQTCRKMAAM